MQDLIKKKARYRFPLSSIGPVMNRMGYKHNNIIYNNPYIRNFPYLQKKKLREFANLSTKYINKY